MQIANTYMAQEKFRDAIPYLNKILEMKMPAGNIQKFI